MASTSSSKSSSTLSITPEDDSDNIVAEAPAVSPVQQDVIILANENDYRIFTDTLVNHPNATLHGIRVLKIHIDTTKLDEDLDYRIAIALQALHPTNHDIAPHELRELRIVIEGNVLFTRHSYYLASPAASIDANPALQKLIKGTLNKKENGTVPYKLICTESGVARALLAIRNIKHVVIEGKSKVEGNFGQTLLGTLIQPTGAGEVQSWDPHDIFCADEMYQPGQIVSEAYKYNARRPYSTPHEAKHNFSTRKSKQSASKDQNARLAEDDLEDFRGTHGPVLAKKSSTSPDEDDAWGLGLLDMVRVRKTKDRYNDLDDEDVVEFGWKI